MPDQPRTVELNEPSQRAGEEILREHLLSAANELYLFELRSIQLGRTMPETLKRAHAAVRAEIKRLGREA